MPALILFEDEHAGRMEPVALTRAAARLRFGLWTHRERWQRMFPDRKVGVICREYLTDVEKACGRWATVDAAGDPDTLFVSAALADASVETEAALRELRPGAAWIREGRPVAVRSGGDAVAAFADAARIAAGRGALSTESPDWVRVIEAAGLTVEDLPGARVADTLVDLVAGNAEAIEADFASIAAESAPPDPARFPGAHFLATDRIRLGGGVRVDPGAVLDARDGPVILGAGTRVHPGCVLIGPVAAGERCVINAGARVMDGVSLGPVCKVGGETDATVIQGWSNKQHDGFLGHSYVGCWVNLGAATDTSDLKNDYGSVRMRIAGEDTDTGRTGVGSLIGDHTKTAIHTRLNTGTVIGVSANVFCPDFPAKEVPSFTWGGGDSRQEYRLSRAVRVAERVMSRRGVEFAPPDEALFAHLHGETAEPRRRWIEGHAAG